MRTTKARHAFSLIELLVSMAVTAILLILMAQVLGDTQSVYGRARTRSTQFRDARAAFDAITRRLSQATLNSYWGCRMDATGTPVLYQRESELHFVSGPAAALFPATMPAAGHGVFFQAPLSVTAGGAPGLERMEDLMNAWGYYVEFNSDLPRRPAFLATDTVRNPERRCFRLMEFRLPSEDLDLYRLVGDPAGSALPKVPWITAQATQPALYQWFNAHLAAHSEPLADHVLALLIQPVTPRTGETDVTTAPDFLYDTRRHQWENPGQPASVIAKTTRHQLPPELRLTLVALEDASWQALAPADMEKTAARLRDLLNRERFQLSERLGPDLEALRAELTALRLQHRIFSTAVPIRAARWTTEQE